MKKLIGLFTLLIAATISTVVNAQVNPIGKDNVAIGGYDVVAYFNSGKAVKGQATRQATHDHVIYYFYDAANRDAFIKNPMAYLPQYDGFCALAVGSQNKKVSINPEAFKITNGKLYLFYDGVLPLSGRRFNSLEPWNKDEANLIKKADVNWTTLKKK